METLLSNVLKVIICPTTNMDLNLNSFYFNTIFFYFKMNCYSFNLTFHHLILNCHCFIFESYCFNMKSRCTNLSPGSIIGGKKKHSKVCLFPKMIKQVTKMSFLQNILDGFSDVLVKDVKLIPDKVLKVWHQYLPPFLS